MVTSYCIVDLVGYDCKMISRFGLFVFEVFK